MLCSQSQVIFLPTNQLLNENLKKLSAFGFTTLVALNAHTINDVDFLVAASCLQQKPGLIRRVIFTGPQTPDASSLYPGQSLWSRICQRIRPEAALHLCSQSKNKYETTVIEVDGKCEELPGSSDQYFNIQEAEKAVALFLETYSQTDVRLLAPTITQRNLMKEMLAKKRKVKWQVCLTFL